MSIATLIKIPDEIANLQENETERRSHLLHRVCGSLDASAGLIAYRNGNDALFSTVRFGNKRHSNDSELTAACFEAPTGTPPFIIQSVLEPEAGLFDCLVLRRGPQKPFAGYEVELVRELHATCRRFFSTTNLLQQRMTSRQRDVLHLLLAGKTEIEVASELCISPHTVHSHVKNIYRILGVHNRIQLANICGNGSHI